jgi:hypothetical protein
MPHSPATAASFPRAASTSTGGEAKKLTLNERFKQLPPWVQWAVIGVFVVVLGIVIFALPTGGGNAPTETEKQKSTERSAPNAEKDGTLPDAKAAPSENDTSKKGR